MMQKRNLKYGAFLLAFFIGFNISFSQDLLTRPKYSILDSISGDLDKDGIKELVIVFNTDSLVDSNNNISRELIIYKKEIEKWTQWKKSSQALYGSGEGGVRGDPFGGIEIKNGLLKIYQNGGSSWIWSVTDTYRYQFGEFYLIGYSSIYGKLCEYFEDIDFNLSTGKLIIKKEFEDCEKSEQEIYKKENENFTIKNIKIRLQERRERDIKFISPKFKHEIYISSKE